MADAHGPAVRYEVSGQVARITLDRPGSRNTLSAEVIDGLLAGFGRARADDEVRAIVLTGAGEKAFCAGGDLGDLAKMGDPATMGEAGDGAGRGVEVENSRAFRLFAAFRDIGKPIIARVAGHALGGGLGLAVSCDVAIAADDVKLGTPEINVGLWPMMIMAVLNRNIAPKQAFKLYYTGQLISAGEAVRVGLLTEAVPRSELDPRVDEFARIIAAKSPAALRLGRAAFFRIAEMPPRDQLRHLHGQLAALAASDDAREGIAAFLEKRPPRFTGT
ncbi:MAG TPA: enoyl-CoA hydratase-related protein [Streptosporangiaceae bacterium]|nr:enoyl-CoA hydratase-related protein [Streptosporangiaceae bacterium]